MGGNVGHCITDDQLTPLPTACPPLRCCCRAQLRSLRFREWAAGEAGEGVAAQLVSVLLTEHLNATGGWPGLACTLPLVGCWPAIQLLKATASTPGGTLCAGRDRQGGWPND